jgi:predicted Zn-dependent peptidase
VTARRKRLTLGAVASALFLLAPFSPAQAQPARPEKLEFPPFTFEAPRAEKMRYELPGGVVVYVVPDHALPLVNLALHLRTGGFLEPAAKPGLAGMTASLLRVGGAGARTPEQFDERADFLAAQLSASAGDTSTRIALNVLTSALDPGLDLLFDMLRRPRFDEARLAVEKGKALEGMKQRNDDADDILAREWSWLLSGREHFSSRRATAAQLESITRADLIDFHRRTYGSERMVIAISGDVEPKRILAALASRLAGFRAAEPAAWPPKGPEFTPKPGLYRVEKDLPQGKVRVGHPSLQVTNWADPDLYALEMLNDVLGGSGFTSRLTKRVRSDEGLAYGAGSSFGFGIFWPGNFQAGYASKNPTVAYALQIVLEEIGKIRREPVGDDELRVAKSAAIDTFPRGFESASQIAGTFAQDELIGRPHGYWYDYRRRIEAVTGADVLRVAAKYLHPDQLVMLVVGKWSEIAPGDPQGRATMAKFGGGKTELLPLRDPLTLEPLAPAP